MKKRFSLYCAILIASAELSIQAQTAIPYLPQLNNFGGSAVANQAAFLPSSNDYTLEVQATAGAEISVANGLYTYTPISGGTVRFVQKNGLIYVYENAVYKTTLTPTPPVVFPPLFDAGFDDPYDVPGTGIYGNENLLENPGFEGYDATVTLISGSSYQDEDVWSVCDANKALNWAAGSPGSSIRNGNTSYTSEGANSLIVHSGSRYVTQKLDAGKLKPNTYYKLDYHFWTSSPASDNGGANYQILLGTELAGNDLLVVPGHATPTTTTVQQVFSTTFLTPTALSTNTDIWVTLSRDISKVDWIDRLCLVEGVASGSLTGITGASSATYLEGAAYAPVQTLSGDDYFDMTPFIVNPNFDSGNTGWTTTTGASNRGVFTAETKGDFTLENGYPNGYGDFAGNVWENWLGSAFTGKMYQTINGLPNGKYNVRATVFANKVWSDVSADPEVPNWLVLYANGSETPVAQPKHMLTYEVETIVADGTLELGVNMKEAIANWVGVDNFQLAYYGSNLDAAADYLQGLIDIASTLTDVMNNTVQTNLQAAISQANSAIATPTEATLTNATTQLTAAIAAAQASIASYVTLAEAIAAANTSKAGYADYPGYSAFETAIAAAQTAYDSKNLDENGVIAAIAALKAAEVACSWSSATAYPIDVTSLIVNPEFESNVTGWTTEGIGVSYNKVSTGEKGDGSVIIAGEGHWQLIGNGTGKAYQFISGLPNGKYILKAGMYVNGFTGEAYLYANAGQTAITTDFSDYYQVEEIVTNNTLEIGIKITAESEFDFEVDHFTLEYYGNAGNSIVTPGVSNVRIESGKGGVNISTPQSTSINIYAVTGQLVKRLTVNGSTFVGLSKGIYIINRQKVIVK